MWIIAVSLSLTIMKKSPVLTLPNLPASISLHSHSISINRLIEWCTCINWLAEISWDVHRKWNWDCPYFVQFQVHLMSLIVSSENYLWNGLDNDWSLHQLTDSVCFVASFPKFDRSSIRTQEQCTSNEGINRCRYQCRPQQLQSTQNSI